MDAINTTYIELAYFDVSTSHRQIFVTTANRNGEGGYSFSAMTFGRYEELSGALSGNYRPALIILDQETLESTTPKREIMNRLLQHHEMAQLIIVSNEVVSGQDYIDMGCEPVKLARLLNKAEMTQNSESFFRKILERYNMLQLMT